MQFDHPHPMTNHTPPRLVSAALIGAACISTAFSLGTRPHGMVVSADSLASSVGAEILRRGGNAVDAAVATGFALAVTYPEAGNVGGGGYMIIRTSRGRTAMIDFRERAPGRSYRKMFLDSAGEAVPGRSTTGGLSSGVPGTVTGLLHALKRFGSMNRHAVLQRPIELAENGIPVNEHLAHALNEAMPGFQPYESTMRVFAPDGKILRAGDTLRQHDLGATFRAIDKRGSAGFYRGRVADMIIKAERSAGGIMRRSDLLHYAVIDRRPVKGTYRGYEIVSAAPSSSGGVILLEILNMLERFDLRSFGHNAPTAIHLFASAAQRAYADRAQYLGDPAYSRVPTATLISKPYASRRGAGIDTLIRTPSSEVLAGRVARRSPRQTTHYCVIDSTGMCVSVTITLNDLFGNKVVVDGAGFFLNDEMDDFVTRPGAPNIYGLTGGEANSIRPGKRMLSTMTPTIVLKKGKPFLLLGGRGGSRIATSVAQALINVVDYGMGIREAVSAPRVHHQWLPDTLYYEAGIPQFTIEGLRARGYTCEQAESGLAELEANQIDTLTGNPIGGPDPREGGIAIQN